MVGARPRIARLMVFLPRQSPVKNKLKMSPSATLANVLGVRRCGQNILILILFVYRLIVKKKRITFCHFLPAAMTPHMWERRADDAEGQFLIRLKPAAV